MARTWLSVTVELLGGRGEDLWPYPGRIFAVGPSHTFADLAEAINDSFARWDRAHLSMFTLADGRVVTDRSTGAELAGSSRGLIITPLDLESAKVVRTLAPGAELQFTFDLGDDWTHRCVVGTTKVDPVEVLGVRPTKPLPYWGWGAAEPVSVVGQFVDRVVESAGGWLIQAVPGRAGGSGRLWTNRSGWVW